MFAGGKNKVLCSSGTATPTRLICAQVVVVVSCNVYMGTPMSRDGNRLVKQIIGVPLRGEHQRAAAYYGTVFGLKAVGMHTFGISNGVRGERVNGLTFRTFPGVAEEATKPGACSSSMSCLLC